MSLHTKEMGETGQRVVFLHGLFGQGKNWTTIGKQLAEDHRVLLVDLPQHGRSPWSEAWDYGEVVDQIAEVLSADDPVALVGHSLGGKVAMLLALRHPELVERLCVVDMSPVTYDKVGEFQHYTSSLKALDLDAVSRREDAERLLEPAVGNPTVRAFLLQNLRRDGDGWRWQANLDVLDRDLPVIGSWPEDELAGVAPYQGRVVWVAGETSDYVAPAYEPAMDHWFPRNRKVVVKDTGHWVHSERPEVFVEVLRRFLSA